MKEIYEMIEKYKYSKEKLGEYELLEIIESLAHEIENQLGNKKTSLNMIFQRHKQ